MDLSQTNVADPDLAFALSLVNLQALSLDNNVQVTDDGLMCLAGLSNLRYLSLRNSSAAGRFLEHLSFHRLIYLDLSDSPVSPRLGQLLRTLIHLECLALQGTPCDLSLASALAALPRLRCVNMSRAALDDAAVYYLAGAPCLESLDVSQTDITDGVAGALATKSSLIALDASHTKVGDRTATALAAATRMRFLSLERTEVSEVGMARLQALTSLRALNVSGTHATADSVLQLCGRDMRRLGIAGLPASGPIFATLANLSPQLTVLDAAGCNFIAAETDALVKLKHLQSLWIACSDANDGVANAINQLPHLRFVDLTGCSVTDGFVGSLQPRQMGALTVVVTGTAITEQGLRALQTLGPSIVVVE